MNYNDYLTVVLTLWDKPRFTRRWMAYANYIHFPFKILIADGGQDVEIERHLSDKKNYPSLNYDYLRYPKDKSYYDYYLKVDDALSKVETPYVVMADNDDFFIEDGLKRAVDFLQNNPAYSSCRGKMGQFGVVLDKKYGEDSGVYGKIEDHHVNDKSVSDKEDTASGRVNNVSFLHVNPCFYDVQRKDTLKKIFLNLVKMNLKDLFLMECFHWFFNAINGKVKRENYLYLMRQYPGIESSAGKHRNKHGDMFDRMLVPTWSEDFGRFVDGLTRFGVDKYGVNEEGFSACVVSAYRRFMGLGISKFATSGKQKGVYMLIKYIKDIVKQFDCNGLLKKIYHVTCRRSLLRSQKEQEIEYPELNVIIDFLNTQHALGG